LELGLDCLLNSTQQLFSYWNLKEKLKIQIQF
jgi:hypothetical protein